MTVMVALLCSSALYYALTVIGGDDQARRGSIKILFVVLLAIAMRAVVGAQ